MRGILALAAAALVATAFDVSARGDKPDLQTRYNFVGGTSATDSPPPNRPATSRRRALAAAPA